MARLGIFGGTFDPPHLGHLILADEAFHQLNLDRLLWVLTPDPPHKLDKSITPLQHRLDMLLTAISGNPHFELCSVDMDRIGPHYAVDTIRILSEKYPGDEWVYLMGGDSLRDLHTWRNPQEFIHSLAAVGVMVRPGILVNLQELDQKIPGVRAKVRLIDAPLVDVSASDIRKRVAKGNPFRYYVPPDVYQIIIDRDLYQIK
jgi:nicotinate-nucleotide adenylyltransferase